MRIARELLDEIVAHALQDAPNECCGMVAARDGEAVQVYRAENAEASPLRYRISSADEKRIHDAIEESGCELGAIYHSHTRSEPYPSQTDVNLAFWPGSEMPAWPGALYLIVGVTGEAPDVRAFAMPDPRSVQEVELEVAG